MVQVNWQCIQSHKSWQPSWKFVNLPHSKAFVASKYIAFSMRVKKWKALEIWSHQVNRRYSLGAVLTEGALYVMSIQRLEDRVFTSSINTAGLMYTITIGLWPQCVSGFGPSAVSVHDKVSLLDTVECWRLWRSGIKAKKCPLCNTIILILRPHPWAWEQGYHTMVMFPFREWGHDLAW